MIDKFKSYLIFLISLIFSFYGGNLHSQDSSGGNDAGSTEYYMAIKGGISLGSYETGLNWALLENVNRLGQDEAKLVAFSGASAGSINSMLSVIKQCREFEEGEYSLFENYMREGWDLGLPELLRTGNDSDEDKESALFTRKPFIEKVKKIQALMSDRKTKPCHLTISMSITRVNPFQQYVTQNRELIGVQRFVVPIEVKVEKAGDRIKFFNRDVDSNDYGIVGPYLKLESKSVNKREIAFEDIVQLAYASSAFPVAFLPVELNYCFANQLKGRNCHSSEIKNRDGIV